MFKNYRSAELVGFVEAFWGIFSCQKGWGQLEFLLIVGDGGERENGDRGRWACRRDVGGKQSPQRRVAGRVRGFRWGGRGFGILKSQQLVLRR